MTIFCGKKNSHPSNNFVSLRLLYFPTTKNPLLRPSILPWTTLVCKNFNDNKYTLNLIKQFFYFYFWDGCPCPNYSCPGYGPTSSTLTSTVTGPGSTQTTTTATTPVIGNYTNGVLKTEGKFNFSSYQYKKFLKRIVF